MGPVLCNAGRHYRELGGYLPQLKGNKSSDGFWEPGLGFQFYLSICFFFPIYLTQAHQEPTSSVRLKPTTRPLSSVAGLRHGPL